MSLAREIRRGAALNARLAVNGIQKAARSLGTASVRVAAVAVAVLLVGMVAIALRWVVRSLTTSGKAARRSGSGLLLQIVAATKPRDSFWQRSNGRKNQQIEGAAAARACGPRAGGDRRHAPDDRQNPRSLRALRVRAGGDT